MKLDPFKIIVSIFAVFLVIFVSFRVYDYFDEPYTTEMAVKMTVNDTVTAKAYALRNEKTIKSDKTGIKVFSVPNGTKVATGADVVEYYGNEQAVAAKAQISALEQKIDRLVEISTQNQFYAADLDSVSSQIKSDLSELLGAVDSNSFTRYSEYENSLLYSMCTNALATKRTADFENQINEYKKQLEALKGSLSASNGSVQSDYSGYFVNSVDGYESAVNYDEVDQLTVADFDKIERSSVGQDEVGKVICDTEWYLVAKIPLSDSHSLSLDKTVRIVLPLASAQTISVSVKALNIDYASDSVLAVFSCLNMNEQLAQLRSQQIQIVVSSYTGLRVNSKAVRVVDGEKGVYVKLGNVIKFRKTDISFSTEDYVIVKQSNDTELKIYDDVIIRGRNLDG